LAGIAARACELIEGSGNREDHSGCRSLPLLLLAVDALSALSVPVAKARQAGHQSWTVFMKL
jgi:hypothetical protein